MMGLAAGFAAGVVSRSKRRILPPFLALCRCRATCQHTCGAICTLAEGGAKLWDRSPAPSFPARAAAWLAWLRMGELWLSETL
jgi:hypothetical protein